jgi:hypothetical protein
MEPLETGFALFCQDYHQFAVFGRTAPFHDQVITVEHMVTAEWVPYNLQDVDVVSTQKVLRNRNCVRILNGLNESALGNASRALG